MRLLIALAVLGAVLSGSVLSGCSSDNAASNPPGAEANTGKTYTAEDANAAQPKRGGQGD